MFQEEKIPAKTREELVKILDALLNMGYFQLIMAFGKEEIRKKLPKEHERFRDEMHRLHKIENYIHDVCHDTKWPWNKIVYGTGYTKEERQQAMTTLIVFSYNRKKRLNDVLVKRYETVFKYCEKNKIDIKLMD